MDAFFALVINFVTITLIGFVGSAMTVLSFALVFGSGDFSHSAFWALFSVVEFFVLLLVLREANSMIPFNLGRRPRAVRPLGTAPEADREKVSATN